MNVIINADDFGFSKGVTLGILESIKSGVVCSTSMMTNTIGFEHGIEIMKQNPGLDVGIHFVLTTKKPLSENSTSLVNENGVFEHNYDRLNALNIEDIRKEFRCQFNRFLATGFTPTHIDFHHEIHTVDAVFAVACEFAKEYNIPMRGFNEDRREIMDKQDIKHSSLFVQDFYSDKLTEDDLINVLEKYKNEEQIEIMCHPSFLDVELHSSSRYSLARMYELDALTSPKVINYIKENNINLIGFTDL